MAQTEEFRDSGRWLFRWRNYLPWITIVLFLYIFRNYTYPKSSHLLDFLWELFCITISFLGLAVRIITTGFTARGTSGRRMKGLKAEQLNTTGLYSFVRHPLYLGNFLIWLGICLFARSFFFTLTCVLLYFLYYERIIFAEENFLREKFSEAFEEWARRTPMIFPRWNKWQKPALPFSLKTVLKREYSTFFLITSAFFCLEVVGDFFYTGRLQFDRRWLVLFLFGLVFYIVFLSLRKWHLLDVEGR